MKHISPVHMILLVMAGALYTAPTITKKKKEKLVYSCDGIYPEVVYCPEGQTCTFTAPECLVNQQLATMGGSARLAKTSVSRAELNVPEAVFKNLGTITKPQKLPLTHYPAMGKQMAFNWHIPDKKQTFIVIKTEAPTRDIIDQFTRAGKDPALLAGQQITSLFKRIGSTGNRYQRIEWAATDNAAAQRVTAVVTPKGNLQVITPKADMPNQSKVREIKLD